MAIKIRMQIDIIDDSEFIRLAKDRGVDISGAFGKGEKREILEGVKDDLELPFDDLIGKEKRWMRAKGDTPTSPCAECAPYIGMIHDMSGREVPMPDMLHGGSGTCVCKDIPVEGYGAIAKGKSQAGMSKFEWLGGQGGETLKRILGTQRSAWFKAGEVSLQDLYPAKRSGAKGLIGILRKNPNLAAFLLKRPSGLSARQLSNILKKAKV